MYLILTMFFLFTGCGQEEVKQDVITENATIYYDPTGKDNCIYTIETDNKKTYTITEKLNNDFNQNNLRVHISYIETNKYMNCGFSGGIKVIEIESIKEL